ncbi:DUF1905 domain-containing protein [Frankia sp. CNm7]|uniref:DUF1905 domain-containing protein n=1 Tax=Frankia nepalensis TaxID=1836974 RepID=A0A937RN08_9ACTN|nr:DUF1905 domain-containing protein [Frankia nepalensis]MBL7516011.1 DUF1905 domain-containing protein [Frankia nepalensis]MBL7522331.1 DUF1905 domain-containing protein [Frankia nepalensis]MBL7631870.1 DUF1905 domain-containing protein [Frankia nepalensis]
MGPTRGSGRTAGNVGGGWDSRPAATFESELARYPRTGGWVFAPVPDDHAPDTAGAFGRVPVIVTVDGRTWPTGVWRDRKAGWLLAVRPASARARTMATVTWSSSRSTTPGRD